ncbi:MULTISPECIES: hypothetical protein [Plesiomonas]|jgi:hypothetical protein|uniref:Uncharacterized protein n=1 Tax=Plesiomonas shigelloides TaxID=703 RepID=A0A379CQ79_PLESH|nr:MULTISPECIES: hypothetical protein [Plesiomonas]MDO4688503.1 hypothetical protein [Plesiomonas sp.]MBO1107568.1 hypothetical protein [Plesiomonas shigelloides]MBW3792763.1 hypothetical protein [Plesiomonas shigelloides]MCE5163376.1 hypothetical protein [Plesiomonas sp. PI-19]MCQ8857001.1 hypothetical protein [Plesiomonas shigelloides]
MTKKVLYIALLIWCALYLLNIVLKIVSPPAVLCDPDVIHVENVDKYFDALYRCNIYD